MKTEDRHHFRLRLPAPLKAWVEREAEANYMSLNGQIVAMLIAQQQQVTTHRAGHKAKRT
jgi:hypothetical protein